jgi:hypothetical protein
MSDFDDDTLKEIEDLALETGLDDADIEIQQDELEGRGVCYVVLKNEKGKKRIATFYEDSKSDYEYLAAAELTANAFSLVFDLVAEIKSERERNSHRAARFLVDRIAETVSDGDFDNHQVVETLNAISSLLLDENAEVE